MESDDEEIVLLFANACFLVKSCLETQNDSQKASMSVNVGSSSGTCSLTSVPGDCAAGGPSRECEKVLLTVPWVGI